jgi:hypothetical protein
MNIRRGLFRLWLIAAVVWIAATTYLGGEDLCASVLDPDKQAENTMTLQPSLTMAKFEGSPNRFRSVVDCFPSTESIEISWRIRKLALARILGVPVAAFLLGYALLWGFKGFRKPT